MRNPRRTAATASALVIRLALVAMVAVLGQSAKAQIDASAPQCWHRSTTTWVVQGRQNGAGD